MIKQVQLRWCVSHEQPDHTLRRRDMMKSRQYAERLILAASNRIPSEQSGIHDGRQSRGTKTCSAAAKEVAASFVKSDLLTVHIYSRLRRRRSAPTSPY